MPVSLSNGFRTREVLGEGGVLVAVGRSPGRPSSLLGRFWSRLGAYFELTKVKQTQLLLLTGWAGYSSSACPVRDLATTLSLLGSLFLAVSGCTILNMVLDADIDRKMDRTGRRPLPRGEVQTVEALLLGLVLSGLGLIWAYLLGTTYGAVITAGLFVDLVVYTYALKRRTPYSIIIGGVAGGMPILAGRVLGIGHIDLAGVLLAATVLLWIPTHIMTFHIKYRRDFDRAGIPTFPSSVGVAVTRVLIALSTISASLLMVYSAQLLGLRGVFIFGLVIASTVLAMWAVASVARPSPRINFGLFKAASLYMLCAMLLIGFGL